MVSEAVRERWEREQLLLGLARTTPGEEFAAGGLAVLAVPPTVRIAVLPGDPYLQPVGPQDPKSVVPQTSHLPTGRQLHQYVQSVRGTSSGYVGFSESRDGRLWRSFAAVHWHGGVDFFLGDQGGREWYDAPRGKRCVFFLLKTVGWAWAAFELQRQMTDRFNVEGPFRAILGIAKTSGAELVNVGAGWPEPGPGGFWGELTAVEEQVLLCDDLPEWPDAAGVESLALRFGARVDLAFGGPGDRHLDRSGPEAGRFNPRW